MAPYIQYESTQCVLKALFQIWLMLVDNLSKWKANTHPLLAQRKALPSSVVSMRLPNWTWSLVETQSFAYEWAPEHSWSKLLRVGICQSLSRCCWSNVACLCEFLAHQLPTFRYWLEVAITGNGEFWVWFRRGGLRDGHHYQGEQQARKLPIVNRCMRQRQRMATLANHSW